MNRKKLHHLLGLVGEGLLAGLCILGFHCWHQGKREKNAGDRPSPGFGKVLCCRCEDPIKHRWFCARKPRAVSPADAPQLPLREVRGDFI